LPPRGGVVVTASQLTAFELVASFRLAAALPGCVSDTTSPPGFNAGQRGLRRYVPCLKLRGYQRITPSGVGVGFTFGAG
jgi:hypothetical protein